MNKTNIRKELKGLWNATKEVNKYFVRRRAWDKNQWQIVDSLDFDNCKVIKEFYYQEELINELVKSYL